MKRYFFELGSLCFCLVIVAACGVKKTESMESKPPEKSEAVAEKAEKGEAPVKKVETRAPEENKTVSTLGVAQPLDRKIEWTAYYITPVKQVAQEKGKTVSFTRNDGKKVAVHLASSSYHEAEMEAVAVGTNKEGLKRYAYRTAAGVWKELPPGSMGMGNRLNPLVPFRHCAADKTGNQMLAQSC